MDGAKYLFLSRSTFLEWMNLVSFLLLPFTLLSISVGLPSACIIYHSYGRFCFVLFCFLGWNVGQVYKGAVISGKEQDSIIGFYNKVYMPAMKPLVLQFAPHIKVIIVRLIQVQTGHDNHIARCFLIKAPFFLSFFLSFLKSISVEAAHQTYYVSFLFCFADWKHLAHAPFIQGYSR